MTACTTDFDNRSLYHAFMKADGRIAIKNYRQNKSSKLQALPIRFVAKLAVALERRRAVGLTRSKTRDVPNERGNEHAS